jgi:RHS repeat-associated protein
VGSTTQTIGSLSAKTLTYQYDKTGNRTRITYPSGKIIDYAYNGNEQITGMSVDSVALANYTYDPLNRRTQKDLLSTVTQRVSYTYDLANQLQQILNNVVNGPVISQYDYTYNQVGNRLTMATSGTPGSQNFNYTYDNIDELTAVSGSQSHTYNYDKVHNRTSADGVTYTSNNLHQYTTVAGVTYTHDPNGNLTNDGTTTYTYDEENRLTTATKPGTTASYTYDAFNRRVSKTVNGIITYFLHDNDEDIAEYSSTGTLQAEYVYGPELDEVLTMDRGAQRYYYSHDGLGSVTEITNSSGAVAESYTYDPYGNPSITVSSIGNPWRFTGRYFDEETGIYEYRNRMYSSKIGRFLQRDLMEYEDSMNLFQYVLNNPVNNIDPYGELTIPFIGWIDVGESAGQSALEYWANKAARTNNPFAGGFYNTMGAFAALWTPCTSDKTATTLSIGAGIGRYLGRPFYQYYPAGNPTYSSPYLTRGWGWKAPYKTGQEAVEKLSLPPHNPGTAVREVKVNPFQYLKGPGRVKPEFGQPGGGIEYKFP